MKLFELEKKRGYPILINWNEQLKNSDYIPVLKAVWSERDKTRRLEWLRSHASEMHAPLMYEQAIAEFINAPVVETVIRISLPLIKAATLRVIQDSSCSIDPSVFNGDAHIRMGMVYDTVLDKQTKKYLNASLQEIMTKYRDSILPAIHAKIQEVAQVSLSQALPSPGWIRFHGLNVFMAKEGDFMHSESDFYKLRLAKVQEVVSQIPID